MAQPIKFEPHIRMFWSNTVDVIFHRPGNENNLSKVGSFTTYGKIMSFVMRFFFCIKFEEIKLDGKIHFVRPKEWEELKRNISSQGDDVVKMLHNAIEQLKGNAPALSETPPAIPEEPIVRPPADLRIGVVPPLPQPPVQQKIKVLSICPVGLMIPLPRLEAAVCGDEFQASFITNEDTPVAALFHSCPARVTPKELENELTELDLSDKPTAVVFCQYDADNTRKAEPPYSHANIELQNKLHRTFHIIGTQRGPSQCDWNNTQYQEIRQFWKEKMQA
jgi:hypothetical protein